MSHGNLLVVIAALVIGVAGAYSTTIHDATGDQLSAVAQKPPAPEQLKTLESEGEQKSAVQTETSASSSQSTPSTAKTKSQRGTTSSRQNGASATVTTRKPVTGGSKNTQSKSQDPEPSTVEAATLAFIKASRSGSASAIARTTVRAMSKGLQERTKWASGAGMDEYKEFGSHFVRILNTDITGDNAEVRLAMKAALEGTDSQYRKVQKYNRTEAFVSLQRENGKWKVSGKSFGFSVWNE